MHGTHLGRAWVYLAVADPGGHYERARDTGAEIVGAPHGSEKEGPAGIQRPRSREQPLGLRHPPPQHTELSPGPDSVGSMEQDETVIRVGDAPVTLINVFEVDPDAQQELLRVLADATEEVMRHRPGFVSANLHVSDDGTRVVNYAQWRSRDDFRAMLSDPAAQEHMQQARALAQATPHVYSVASIHHA